MSVVHYYAGIDGGGSKCRAQLFDLNGNCLATAIAGPANIAQQPQQAQQSMVRAISAALSTAQLPPSAIAQTSVCAGLAGANVASAQAALQAWSHPFAQLQVISDLQAAVFGAHAGGVGAVMIIGTGSCAAGWSGQHLQQWGGHGFLLGDKGSGAWLGLRAVQHTLEVLDQVQPPSALAERVQQQLRLLSSQDLVAALHQAPAAQFASLAPMIIELASAGESVAQPLVASAASYLDHIGRQAAAFSGGRLVLVGGLAPLLQSWLSADLQALLAAPQHGPEWGAVAWFHRGLLCPVN